MGISRTVVEDLKIDIAFESTSANAFLNAMEGQAGLIHMDHGENSEETARLHEEDARVIIDRELVRPGGYVLIDDHDSEGEEGVPKSKYSQVAFENAGFDVIEEGYQLLLWRPVEEEFAIPKILHFFKWEIKSPMWEDRVETWSVIHGHQGWQVRVWTKESLWTFIAENFRQFIHIWETYQTEEEQLAAARYLVLRIFGGGALKSTRIPLNPVDSLLESRRLVLVSSRDSLDKGPKDEVVSDQFIASTPGHLFWNGMERALEENASTRDESTRTGVTFLSRRVRTCTRFLDSDDLPSVLGNVDTILPVYPDTDSSCEPESEKGAEALS